MYNDDENPELWDEKKWDEYVNSAEERSDLLRRIFYPGYNQKKIIAWLKSYIKNTSFEDAIEEYIDRELDFEHDIWMDEDSEDDKVFGTYSDDEDDEENDFKYGILEQLSIYVRARSITTDAFRWYIKNANDRKIDENVTWLYCWLCIVVKLVCAYCYGVGYELLGGSIACNKKALSLANIALSLIEKAIRKENREYNKEVLLHFYDRTYQFRNDIAFFVYELRQKKTQK